MELMSLCVPKRKDLEIPCSTIATKDYSNHHETRNNAGATWVFGLSNCQVTDSLLWALHLPSMLHITVNVPMVPNSITQSTVVK